MFFVCLIVAIKKQRTTVFFFVEILEDENMMTFSRDQW